MEFELSKSRNIYAITLLEEFFDYYGPAPALRYTEKLLYCAMHWKYYKDSEPYAMVFLCDWLRKLVPACLDIERAFRYSNDFEVKPAENGLPNLQQCHDFMPGNCSADKKWTYLPRYVSAKQYLNPIRALRKLDRYKTAAEWTKTIDELQEYALCHASIKECYPAYNMLRLRLVLLRAIEACHLILLRYQRYKQEAVAGGAQPGDKEPQIKEAI